MVYLERYIPTMMICGEMRYRRNQKDFHMDFIVLENRGDRVPRVVLLKDLEKKSSDCLHSIMEGMYAVIMTSERTQGDNTKESLSFVLVLDMLKHSSCLLGVK